MTTKHALITDVTGRTANEIAFIEEAIGRVEDQLDGLTPEPAPAPPPSAAPPTPAPPTPTLAPATPAPPTPLPELVAEDVLPVVRVDVDATNASGVLRTTPVRAGDARKGQLILFPDGSRVNVDGMFFNATAFHQDPGNRTILRAEGRGHATIAKNPGVGGALVGLRVKDGFNLASSLELENLTVDASEFHGSNCVLPLDVRYVGIRNCDLRGGSNTLGQFTFPTVWEVSDTEISRGGRGNRKHVVYISYCERATFTRVHIHSPNEIGHAFKFYGRDLFLSDSLIETYADDASLIDPDRNGWLVDIGGWGNTQIIGNRFINKTFSTKTLVYKNRQYDAATWPKFRGFGTVHVDEQQVDNSDPANPHLYRHLLMDNVFAHQTGAGRGAVAVQNSGTASWLGGNGSNQDLLGKPVWWTAKNHRAAVDAVSNSFSPYYEKHYLGQAIEDRHLPTPIRELDQPPAWFTG